MTTTDAKLILPAHDPATIEARTGTNYPEQFNENISAREKRRLGEALGLTRLGVNLTRLKPGLMSSQRHWHSHEDEFVIVLEGELVLITDGGEQVLSPGIVAGFAGFYVDFGFVIADGVVAHLSLLSPTGT